MANELAPEPLINEADLFDGWEMILPLKGVNLTGLPGGRLHDQDLRGGRHFLGYREYEEGDDASDIDAELTAEDPDHWPVIRENHWDIRPTLWIASDMLKQHQRGVDGYYDKRGLALSAIFAVLRTAFAGEDHLPTAVVAANDSLIDATDRPQGGKQHVIRVVEKLNELMQPEKPLPALEERPLLSEMLSFIGQRATKRAVTVVSDFRSAHFWPDHPKDNWKQELENIAQRKNEIIAIEVTSPEDSKMPKGLETINHSPLGRIWAGRDGKKFRERYQENAVRQQEAIDQALADVDAVHVRLRTDDPRWFSSLDEQLRYPELRVYPTSE